MDHRCIPGVRGLLLFSNLQQPSLTGRKQLIATGTQEEAALGLHAYNDVLSQSQVVPSGPEVSEIRGIMQRLVAVAPKVEADLAAEKGAKPHIDWGSFQWAVSVLQSPEVNALTGPKLTRSG